MASSLSTMSASTLAPLPNTTALWRIEKLPVAEIKQRLLAAGLSDAGTKRTLAKRLHHSLTHGSDSDSPSEGAASSPTRAGDRNGRSSSPAAADDTSPPRERTRRRARRRRRSVRRGTGRHSRHHGRHSVGAVRSSTSSSTTSSTGSSSSSSRTGTTSRGSSSRSTSPSPRRSRGGRRSSFSRAARERRRNSPSRAARSTTRSRSRQRHRRERRGREDKRLRHSRSRRGRHHREASDARRSAGSLPPISSKLQLRIRRGEYVNLAQLLHSNLTKANLSKATGHKRGRSGTDTTSTRQASAAITDFSSWSEAWSIYATVLSSFHSHLAPRLFQYQHFLTLKAKSFQASAWLRYDSEFRLKLAANGSWRFDIVDTELWASCFAADGLSPADPTPAPMAPMACYTCGSLTHLYAACPQRRQATYPRNSNPTMPKPGSATTNPPARPAGEQQEPCYIFNDKGRCFRGSRCPYLHTCTHCGGQHAKRSCPTLQN